MGQELRKKQKCDSVLTDHTAVRVKSADVGEWKSERKSKRPLANEVTADEWM